MIPQYCGMREWFVLLHRRMADADADPMALNIPNIELAKTACSSSFGAPYAIGIAQGLLPQ